MSSSYDAAMVDTAMIEDPRLLSLPRGTRLLFLEMLVWAKLRRTDGHVALCALPRLTDEPDPGAAASQLEARGLLRTDQEIGGFWIVDFAASQWTAEQVQRRIDSQREARERYEERHPNRPRSGLRDKSRERSRDGSYGPTDRPTERSEEVGSGGLGSEEPAAARGMVNGRPLKDVSRELVDQFPQRYAAETISGHLGRRSA